MAQTVLISQPNLYNYTLYMPYIYACLKTAAQQHDDLVDAYDWAWPIYYNKSAAEMYEPYKGQKIDVLGLSCYTWNSQKNYELAALVKADNPDCLVVAGGPDPDYRDPEWFDKNPVDLIVRQDGEIPFTEILRAKLSDDPDYGSIHGVLVPGGDPYKVGAAKQTDFSVSPYLAEEDFFNEVMAQHTYDHRQEFRVYWETDRGCPYGCNFCDWGSNTLSKIRRFPMDRIKAEIDWMARSEIKFIHLTNANWGILPQDVEISKLLAENKAKHGVPKKMYYSAAKNNIKRVVESAKILYDAGLVDHHTMGVQHTDPEVLMNMDRSNLPVATQADITKQLQDHGLPVLVQMIFGGPGDTPEKWAKALTDIMGMGIHEEYRCYAFNLLPNSPAANPRHIEKFDIRTSHRYTYTVRRKKNSDPDSWSKTDYITSTFSYNEEDWADMYVFDSFISAFHNSGLTQFLSRYLNSVGVSYYQFYVGLYRRLNDNSVLTSYFDQMRDHLEIFASEGSDEAIEEMDIPEANAKHLYRPNEFLLYYAMNNLDQLMIDISVFVYDEGWGGFEVDDLLVYTEFVMITPDYNAADGRVERISFNWPEFFNGAELVDMGTHQISTMQQNTGTHLDVPLVWSSDHEWIEAVIGVDYSKAKRAFFQEIVND